MEPEALDLFEFKPDRELVLEHGRAFLILMLKYLDSTQTIDLYGYIRSLIHEGKKDLHGIMRTFKRD